MGRTSWMKFYESIEPKEQYSLVAVKLHTGRTHQIRVHMLSIGHPMVSDLCYAKSRFETIDKFWCPRNFLHAHHITFADVPESSSVDEARDLAAVLEQTGCSVA